MQKNPETLVNRVKTARKRFQKEPPQTRTSAVSQNHISRNFKLISTMWTRLSSEIYGELFGLAVPEIRVIWALSRASGLTGSELSSRTKMDKGSTSRAVAFLVDQGVLEKKDDPNDKRLVRVELTQDGRALSKEIEAIRQLRQAELAAALSEDELATLHVVFQKLEQTLLNSKSASELSDDANALPKISEPDAEVSD